MVSVDTVVARTDIPESEFDTHSHDEEATVTGVAQQAAGALFRRAVAEQQGGRELIAIDLYRRALVLSPSDSASIINLAAIDDHAPRRIMDLPKRAAMIAGLGTRAFINLGNRLEREGGDGGPFYRRAALYDPGDELCHRRLAVFYVKHGDHAAGEQQYRRALRCDRRSTVSLMGLGNLHRRAGRLLDAHDCHSIAARWRPDDWRPLYNLTLCLVDAGSGVAARRRFHAVLRKSPDPTEPLTQLARHYLDRQQPGHAGALFTKALLLRPGSTECLGGLAQSTIGQDPALARRLFDRAKCAVGTQGPALSELARLFWEAGEHETSRVFLERAVDALPGHADPHANLAQALNRLWYGRPALRSARRAAILDPSSSRHWNLTALAHIRFAEIDAALANHRRARFVSQNNQDYASTELFTLLYSETASSAEKARQHRVLANSLMPAPPVSTSRIPDQPNPPGAMGKSRAWRKPRKKIRVGYFSPDFMGNHPVALFAGPLFTHHDRDRFAVHVYEANETRDRTTARLQALTDGWRHVRTWRTERIVQTIRDDGIDILVDLCGHTAGNRMDVFASGAAPIQVGFIGYPHSTGLPAMTHLLADSVVAPPHLDHLFTETVIRLPQCVFCVDPESLPVAIDPTGVEQRRQIVFGSFNNFPKIGPRTIALWARVLHAVPGSLLRLKAASFRDPEFPRHCRRLFAAHGINENRLVLVEPSGFKELLAEYAEIDIALDPLTYNGGTTTCQALWMGVPVVTLEGDNFCSRMGTSILGHAGFDEWVAGSETDYVVTAVRLAGDRAKLVALRHDLRGQLSKTGFADVTGYTQAVEKAYESLAGSPIDE